MIWQDFINKVLEIDSEMTEDDRKRILVLYANFGVSTKAIRVSKTHHEYQRQGEPQRLVRININSKY